MNHKSWALKNGKLLNSSGSGQRLSPAVSPPVTPDKRDSIPLSASKRESTHKTSKTPESVTVSTKTSPDNTITNSPTLDKTYSPSTSLSKSLRPLGYSDDIEFSDTRYSSPLISPRVKKDIHSMSKQELEERVRELESEKLRMKREKKDIVSALNESFKTVGTFEESIRELREEIRTLYDDNKAFQLEKEMLVKQLNKSFVDQNEMNTELIQCRNSVGSLQSIKEEYDILLQKLQETMQLVNTLTLDNQSLRKKLDVFEGKKKILQEQTDAKYQSLEKDQELQIQKLMEERDNLKEMWKNSLNEQSNLQTQNDKYRGTIKNLENRIGGLTSPNPAYAVEKLKEERDPQFMYSCKSLDHKNELLQIATQTKDPDAIQAVIYYLKCSLKPSVFDSLLFPCGEAVTCYLKYLLEEGNRKEWKRITLQTRRYDDLALYYYGNASNKSTPPEKKREKLKSCLRIIKKYNCLTHLIDEIEACLKESTQNHVEDK